MADEIASGRLPSALGLVSREFYKARLGALFGFCVYAAYDITNLATLRGWPMAVSLVDLVWAASTAAATLAAFLMVRSVQAS